MPKYLILSSLFILVGCASQTASSFEPFTVEISDEVIFNNDLITCRQYALEYLNKRSSVSPSEVATEGATAGFKNLGSSIISPEVTALSALGGASSEAISELGLNSLEVRKIISNCLHDKGSKSGAYLVIDPNL